jgi:hypothetical protein
MKRLLLFVLLSIAAFALFCSKNEVNKETKVPAPEPTRKTETMGIMYTAVFSRGNVSWSPDDNAWNKLEQNMKLNQGCFVETGRKSCATLNGNIGDVIMMDEQVKIRLTLEELMQQGKKSSLAMRGIQLLQGLAKFDVQKGNGKFIVETPSARINVKGTIFTVNVDSTGKTDVVVIEGSVSVIPLNDTTNIFDLKLGEVLRNAGGKNIFKTICEKQDTVMRYKEEIPNRQSDNSLSDSDSGKTESVFQKNDSIMKTSLASNPAYRGKATHKAAIEADILITKERETIGNKIEKEKITFDENKNDAEAVHAEKKAAAEQKQEHDRLEAENRVDGELDRSNAKIEKVRAEEELKMEKERSSNIKEQLMNKEDKAEDAFDELQKRRGND